jgi:hypothetical protein
MSQGRDRVTIDANAVISMYTRSALAGKLQIECNYKHMFGDKLHRAKSQPTYKDRSPTVIYVARGSA